MSRYEIHRSQELRFRVYAVRVDLSECASWIANSVKKAETSQPAGDDYEMGSAIE